MHSKLPRRFGLLVILAILVYGAMSIPLAQWLDTASDWASQNPVVGPLAYLGFVIVAAVVFLPGSVAIMVGGYLFGFSFGLLLAAIAVPLAAQCAFEAGRWLARRWVQAKIAKNPRLHAIEAGLQEQAFLIVALTRLSLILPFNLLNYAYGATSVKARIHFLATAAGMLPAVLLYVYLGTLAKDLGQILSGDAAPPDLGYWIIAAGLVVIAFVTWVIHRTATRTLEKHLGTNISQ